MRLHFPTIALASLLVIGCSDGDQQRIADLENQLEEKRVAELEYERKKRLELQHTGFGERVVERYGNGQKLSEGYRLDDGTRVGFWTQWDEYGRKQFEGTITNGEPDGFCTFWDYSWDTAMPPSFWYWTESTFDKGKIVESMDFLRTEGWVRRGVYKNEEWEDKWEDRSLYRTGTQRGHDARNIGYTAWKRHGLWTWWYKKDGQKYVEATYKDGILEGPYISWHANGQMSFESDFKNGNNDGVVLSWYESGLKMYEGIYRDGEVVSSELWWSDGSEALRFGTIESPVFDSSSLMPAIYIQSSLIDERETYTDLEQAESSIVNGSIIFDIAAANESYFGRLTRYELRSLIDMCITREDWDIELGDIIIGFALEKFPDMKDGLTRPATAIEKIRTEGRGVDLSGLGYAGKPDIDINPEQLIKSLHDKIEEVVPALNVPAERTLYKIRSGDTLGKIAKRELGSARFVDYIKWLNPGLMDSSFRIGDTLVISFGHLRLGVDGHREDVNGDLHGALLDPKLSLYTIKSGDILGEIAQKELGSVRYVGKIKELNPSLIDSNLIIGGVLVLPAKHTLVENVEVKDNRVATPAKIHVVTTGDSLTVIAEKYYPGKDEYIEKIVSENKKLLVNGKNTVLRIGWKLILPE